MVHARSVIIGSTGSDKGWDQSVKPPSLRAELARLGSELVARYGGGAAPPYGGGAAPPDGADPARDETGRRSVTAEPG